MKKIGRILFILLLSQLMVLQGFAQTSVPDLDTDLLQQSKFIKLMLQVGEQIDHEMAPDADPFKHPESMKLILEKKIGVYHQYFEQALEIPNFKKDAFKKAFYSLKWDQIPALMKKAHIGTEVFFKKKGAGIAIAMMLGFVCKFTLPILLTSIGLAQLIPALILIPYPFIFAAIPGQINKLKLKKVLADELGGEIQLKAYLKQQDSILAIMHMKDPEDFLLPLNDDSGNLQTAVIQNETMKNNLLTKLGMNQDSLNLTNLKTFLNESRVSDSYIDWILSNDNIEKQIKAVLITSHIYSLKNNELQEKFQNQFSASFVSLKGYEHWEISQEWMQNMLKAKNTEDIFLKLKSAPEVLHPKEVAVIWENYLLPEYVKNFQLSYSEARAMYTQFEVIKAKLNTTSSSILDLRLKNDLFNYLKKMMEGKKFKGCTNSSEQIHQYLLKAI